MFTLKHNSDGTIKRYIVWLVAKGFTHTCNIDYSETFVLVVKLNTNRILLFLVSNLDVKKCVSQWWFRERSVYGLHSRLRIKIWVTSVQTKEVFIWTKTIPKSLVWKLTLTVKKQGYTQVQEDHTLFTKPSQK